MQGKRQINSGNNKQNMKHVRRWLSAMEKRKVEQSIKNWESQLRWGEHAGPVGGMWLGEGMPRGGGVRHLGQNVPDRLNIWKIGPGEVVWNSRELSVPGRVEVSELRMWGL